MPNLVLFFGLGPILALKIFHKVIVTVVYLQDTVQIRILAKHADVEIPL